MSQRTSVQHTRAEKGGVAVLISIFFGTMVLFGVAALSLDVGSIWWERRQLQNAADAAVMALANQCAKGSQNCRPDSTTTTTYANLNVKDGTTSTDGVCSRFGTGFTPPVTSSLEVWSPCASGTDTSTVQDQKLRNLGECVPVPTSLGTNVPYVEVKIGTSNSGGAPEQVRSIFSRIVKGTDNPHVSACARAAWGPPGGTGTTFPLTLSVCDWYTATSGGFAPAPPYTPGPATVPNAATSNVPAVVPSSKVVKITAHENSNPATACGPSMNAPGGFGWLDEDPNAPLDCSSSYNGSGAVDGSSGAAPTQGCKADGIQKWLGKEVLIPIFTSVSGTGDNTFYTLEGVSSFYLAGWQNMQTAQPNKDYSVYNPPSNNYCGSGVNAKTCIWGWFTSPILPLGTLPGNGTPRGPVVVAPAG